MFIIGIITSIGRSEFIVLVFILHEVLAIINVLSNQLQNTNTTLGKSVTIIYGVISTFKILRSDESFSNLWTRIEKFSEENEIDLQIPTTGIFFVLYI